MSGVQFIEQVLMALFLTYMLATFVVYLTLNVIALRQLKRYMGVRRGMVREFILTAHEPPITIVVPAYNEAETIASSIRSLAQLQYADFEIVVVNDGSRDGTLEALKREFELYEFPEAYRARLKTKPIRAVYRSRVLRKLRVVDKDNGGKADAINAGLNMSRSPLFCCVDADSVLERYSLLRAVQPFIEDPTTVACGGSIRIANGCVVRGGHVVALGIPTNALALFQIVEYLRSFLFGRVGWSGANGLLIISGAFGILHKETVVRVGGYAANTVGEDMELIVRLHRVLSKERRPYRITFIPDPICWTEVPESLRVFQAQRSRWHRGLSESLWLNRELMFARGSGVAGWLAFPFFVFFEWLSPFVEVAGYVFCGYLIAFGRIDYATAVILLGFAVSLSVTLSTVALFLDEMTFRGYSRLRQVFVLFLVSFVECFGYRQLNALFRLQGAFKWMFRTKSHWGRMVRKGAWQR